MWPSGIHLQPHILRPIMSYDKTERGYCEWYQLKAFDGAAVAPCLGNVLLLPRARAA
jgi:hypothetical protein